MRPVALTGIFLLTLSHVSFAQEMIEDRDFAVDLHRSYVLGSSQLVGMGGAGVALARGSSGILSSASAPSVRPDTRSGKWGWDWHVDWLNPSLGDDLDNNGTRDDSHQRLITAGIVGQYKHWALGVTLTTFQTEFETPETFKVSSAANIIALSRTFAEGTHAVGLGVKLGVLAVDIGGQQAFSQQGGGLTAGYLYKPGDLPIRIGASIDSPVVGRELTVDNCDPNNCQGLILPETVKLPAIVRVGAAWKFSASQWNQPANTSFRDEKYILVSTDLVITGPVKDAFDFERFTQQEKLPSGNHWSAEPHVGAEMEVIPGWLRLRAGSYWEASRVHDQPGRLHGTAGIESRFWQFSLWGERRLRVTGTFDFARNYGNWGISVGFWN